MPVSANNRIFYACQAVAFQQVALNGAPGTTIVAHGVQSVGINTTFNLEQVFELGQIHIYENIEGLPDIEVTLEKVLDGYPLLFHLATSAAGTDSALTTSAARTALVARAKQRCNVLLGIFPDTVEHVANTNDFSQTVLMSGMYVGSIGYTIPVDGNCTESLTLVGNNKMWLAAGATNGFTKTLAQTLSSSGVGGAYFDEPKALLTGTTRGGIQRRENVALNRSILPKAIAGGSSAGTEGNGWSTSTNPTGVPKVHIQNISINCDLSRESVQELGRKGPYVRYANFPVEVTCEFEIIALSGDLINATELGSTPTVFDRNVGNNTSEETIKIRLHDGTIFDLGNKNRLSSVNYTGGDAGGGNATITYSYSTYNNLSVYHPEDPTAGTKDVSFYYNGQ